MLLLFDSSLIIFRAPPKSRLIQPCTLATLRQIEKVTSLADYTKGIDIVCTPNIWTQKDGLVSIEITGEKGKTGIEEMCDTPTNSDSVSSSISFASSKSHTNWLDNLDYFDLTELIPSQSTFKRTYFRSDGESFDVCESARFFVIKSYSNLDVQASMQNGIWASTELGNRRLDKAFRETDGEIYLFFSVNSSAKFCGVAKMESAIDFSRASDIWVESSRWKGVFPVEWLIVKEVPNRILRHLRVFLNENKPVANSRDTQELPIDVGFAMMGIFDAYDG